MDHSRASNDSASRFKPTTGPTTSPLDPTLNLEPPSERPDLQELALNGAEAR
jgi:hypothetical protein